MSEESRIIAAWLQTQGALPPALKADQTIEDIERKLTRKLRGLQAGVEAEIIRQLIDRGRIPGTRWGREKLIERVLADSLAYLPDTVMGSVEEIAQHARESAINQIRNAGGSVSLGDMDPAVLERLREKTYIFSQDTLSRIQGDFAESLGRAYSDGLGIDEAIEVIRDDFYNLRHNRLEAIARTEIQGTQNEAADATMVEAGVEYKQWLTAEDDRVRGNDPADQYDHIHLHGQVVRTEERFSNGMNHPGDRSADPGDFINCRCRARPYIPRPDERISSTPYYP